MTRGRLVLSIVISMFVSSTVFFAGGVGAAPTNIDFEQFSSGTLVQTQLQSQGVVFPQGLEANTCNEFNCQQARSGTKVVIGVPAGEFAMAPFEAVFNEKVEIASIWVRSDVQYSPVQNIEATIRAYSTSSGTGGQITSKAKTFASDASWQQMLVASLTGATIKRIVVTSKRVGFSEDSNFLAYDDLSFDAGDAPPSPSPSSSSVQPSPSPSASDTVAPLIGVTAPSAGSTQTSRGFTVAVEAQDHSGLVSVTGSITGPPEAEPYPLSFCGYVSRPCSLGSQVQTFSIPVSLDQDSPNGFYRVEARACDPHGNCGTATHSFNLQVEAPPEVTEVSVQRVEVNQGVQSLALTRPDGPGSIAKGLSNVPLVAEKDTLVRWYVFGDGGVVEDFTARMKGSVFHKDGTVSRIVMNPNTVNPAVDLQPLPSTEELQSKLMEMRADVTGTLNFVIPGDDLKDAEAIQLRLYRVDPRPPIDDELLAGIVQYDFSGPARVGVRLVRISGSAAQGPPIPPDPVLGPIITGYMQQAYPLSEARVVGSRTLRIQRNVLYDVLPNCSFLLWQASLVVEGDWNRFTRDPNVVVNAGVVPDGAMSDANGCAWLGDASDLDDRRGMVLITRALSDTAAHELGHLLGFLHASDDHGEEDGGPTEKDFEYAHGTIGDNTFGVILTRQLAKEESQRTWRVNLVDPCPTTDFSQRWPTCTMNESNRPHDIMSYGGTNAGNRLAPFTVGRYRWPSDNTYHRVWDAIVRRRSPIYDRRTSTAASDWELTDSLLINVYLGEDGKAHLMPLFRRMQPKAWLTAEGSGDHEVKLLDSLGRELFARTVPAQEIGDVGDSMIRVVAPIVEEIDRIQVMKGNQVILEEEASPSAPVVEITSPKGGETFASGQMKVAWTASDADGDGLSHLVQFSPDGGNSWQGLHLAGPGEPTEATIDVSGLLQGTHGLIRVVTSDGLNTTDDTTDVFFSLGTSDPPASSGRVFRTLSLKLKKGTATGRLKAPGGPLACVAEMPVVLKKGKKTVARGQTDMAGRVKLKFSGRSVKYRLVAKRQEAELLRCEPAKSPMKKVKR